VPRRSTLLQQQRQDRRTARQRIIDVTRDLLKERAWSDIPLEEVMSEAGLTRTAFYRHFDDRDQLLLALLDELGIEVGLTPDPWQIAPDDPHEGLRQGLVNLTALYVEHGSVLCAISDAASRDSDVARRYDALADRLVAQVERRLRLDIAEGRTRLDDPHEVARALVWMNERYLTQTFGGRHHRATAEAAAAALEEIWRLTLYGRD